MYDLVDKTSLSGVNGINTFYLLKYQVKYLYCCYFEQKRIKATANVAESENEIGPSD